MLFIHEMFLVYKLETFKNCKEVKHIMIIAMNFFILYIWTVENYFQKILSPSPLKKSTPPFLLTTPLKIKKLQVPLFANIEFF